MTIPGYFPGHLRSSKSDRSLMALRENRKQVSPLRLKITVLAAGLGPLIAVGLWLQSKGFFN
jgi:hypothetical protein